MARSRSCLLHCFSFKTSGLLWDRRPRLLTQPFAEIQRRLAGHQNGGLLVSEDSQVLMANLAGAASDSRRSSSDTLLRAPSKQGRSFSFSFTSRQEACHRTQAIASSAETAGKQSSWVRLGLHRRPLCMGLCLPRHWAQNLESLCCRRLHRHSQRHRQKTIQRRPRQREVAQTLPR